MNIVIPIAGLGSRFTNEGYSTIKPLIEFNGKTMIEWVIDNIRESADPNFIFIIKSEDEINFSIKTHLLSIDKNFTIIESPILPNGPAASALLSEDIIKDDELIIINSDQIILDLNIKDISKFAHVNKLDGIIGCFISTYEKNSYIKLDDNGYVSMVREKEVISNIATNGLHYWKSGNMFVDSAKKMILNNDTVNNEFYVAPTYNYMIKDDKKIKPFFFNFHYSVGTPTDLKKYLNEII
jgi:dTDP-glucose pyrophosphorylase